MVHVQFIERVQTLTAGGYYGGQVEVPDIYGGAELVVARSEDKQMEVDDGHLFITENTGPYWSARVDCFEAIESMPNELDSDEDDDEDSDGSADEGDDAFAGGPSRRAVANEMDELTVQRLVISADVNSRWGFDEDTLMVGQRFPTKEATKIEITKYAVSISRQYKNKRSDPEYLKVVCVDLNCPGRIRAIQRVGIQKEFEITVLVDHTCELSEPLTRHRNVGTAYVAEKVHHLVSKDISVGPKALMSTIADEVGFPITYSMVRRAKQKVIERMFGTFEEGYNYAPRLLHQIGEANPGSYMNKRERPYPDGGPACFVLDRLFWAFSQTIEAFKYCRPVLSVDGTFLTGKYKGTLLIAMAADGNDQILPVAYAIVESENSESWLWFLINLKLSIVRDIRRVCLISYRNAGLLNAISAIRSLDVDEWRWSDVEHRFCMRHLAANFFARFRSKDLMKTFKKLCMQNQLRKFQAIWAVLEEATARYSGELNPVDLRRYILEQGRIVE